MTLKIAPHYIPNNNNDDEIILSYFDLSVNKSKRIFSFVHTIIP